MRQGGLAPGEMPRRENRQKPLQDVAGEGDEPPFLADGTENVRRADILGPDRPHVDAARLADEKSERDAPDQIRRPDKQSPRQQSCIHDRSPSPSGKTVPAPPSGPKSDSRMRSTGVVVFFLLLQSLQHGTQFDRTDFPPRATGMTWSIVRFAAPTCRPQ